MTLHVTIGPVSGDEKPRAFDVALPGALQGDPVLGDGYLLVPLANGILARVHLQDGALINGPDWRAKGAEQQARGHIAFLGAHEFILTDGSRGLATCVLAALLAHARARGCTTAYLQVEAGNAPARRAYSRFGSSDRYAYWYRRPPTEGTT